MLISEFDYDLPENLIAQQPAEHREGSRMLSVDRSSGSLKDLGFRDFAGLLGKGDVLVLNNTKVFPARLIGNSETGGRVELFLVEELEDGVWETLAKPVRRLNPGKRITCGGLTAQVREITNAGRVIVSFDPEDDFDRILESVGKTPLPPYIKRESEYAAEDRERYQTVYAKRSGAIAAPTAGLHFTPKILEEIKEICSDVIEITLHVGYGTFEPVRVEDLTDHTVMPEKLEIEENVAERLNKAVLDGKRMISVGTTTARALESCSANNGKFIAGKQTADLTITPGYRFNAVDALLTNFHLPRSSLLVMVSTFGGYELIMNAYRHAVGNEYRFYSYGDCMFVF